MSYWRDTSRKVIAKVLKENEGKEEKEIKAALREAYPFGARAYHPYKIWLDEIQIQLGNRKFGKQKHIDKNQQELF